MRLFTYFRSSAAYRVRIALNLKGLTPEMVPVHLVKGEQRAPEYLAVNPAGLVPALEDEGAVLTQSLAIIEYLDEVHPRPALLPAAPLDRARVRALTQAIACDLHPLNCPRVLKQLAKRFGADEAARDDWYRHWVMTGLEVVEAMLAGHPATGTFCNGDAPGMADCVLVPQVFNAKRFDCPLDAFPTITRIVAACDALEPFRRAAPVMQADAD